MKFKYATLIIALCLMLSPSSLVFAAQEISSGQNIKTQEKPKNKSGDKTSEKASEKTSDKASDAAKIVETPIENVNAITTEQLAEKPAEYLNKNVRFTAPFFAFSNLALDYKPAFRSHMTYLSFLVLRPNSKTPFSELKLAMLIPKEKDPNTKMLQTLKEGDIVEITGHVFACSLDEPWVDVLRLKKIASAKKSDNPDDHTADDKDSSDSDSTDK